MDYRQFVLFVVFAYQFDIVICFKAVGVDATLSAKFEVDDGRRTIKVTKKWNARKFFNARYIPHPDRFEWLQDEHQDKKMTELMCMIACHEYRPMESNPNKQLCRAVNFCEKGNDCGFMDNMKVKKGYPRCILLAVGLEEGKEYENYDAVENPNWVHFNPIVEIQ